MKSLLSIVCLLSLAGCMSFSDRAMRPVANSIREQMPQIRLEKEFAVSLGSGMFNVIDLATGSTDDLSDMEHVHVAVYNVFSKGKPIDFNLLNLEQTLLVRNSRLHWETIVRVRKADEQTWVLVGMDLEKQTLEEVAVFSLGSEELVLINVDGELDQLLRFAMQPAQDHRSSIRKGRAHT